MYHSVSDFLFILERKRKLLCTLSLAVAKWIKKTPKPGRFYLCNTIQTVTLHPKVKPMKRNTAVSLWKISPALLLNLCSEDTILLEYAEIIISIHLLDFNFIAL